MRWTLRRSCAACAKAKQSCDLETPKCSRCVRRGSSCRYANEPLSTNVKSEGVPIASKSLPLMAVSRTRSAHATVSHSAPGRSDPLNVCPLSMAIGAQTIDPFDTYPSTNLPRDRVQGLIHHCWSLKMTHPQYTD